MVALFPVKYPHAHLEEGGSANFIFIGAGISLISEGVSTGVWCVSGFGAGLEFALEPSKLQKEGENPGKGHF